MIRKLPNGKFRLYSLSISEKTGKRKILGTFNTRADALKRERQIQYFKHLKARPNPPKTKVSVHRKNPYIDKYGSRRDGEDRILNAFIILLHKYKTLYKKVKEQNKIDKYKNIIEYYVIFLEGLKNDFEVLIAPGHKYEPYWSDFDVAKEYGFFPKTTIVDDVIDNFMSEIKHRGRLIFSQPTNYDPRSPKQKVARAMDLLELLAINYKTFEEEIKKCLKNEN